MLRQKSLELRQRAKGDIADEVEEARDNMSGTNLENTERYQRYDEAADTLRQACDDIDNAKSNAEDVEL